MWTIDQAALEQIAIGAGLLGTGGGGNPYLSKVFAGRLLAEGHEMTVVDLAEVPDDAFVTSVGGMGSPTIGIERLKQGDEPLVALRALERYLGRRFTHLIAGEIGGANSVAPLIVSAQTGLAAIDADGMGRAFPELQMDTFAIYGVRPTPGAIADHHGQVAIFDAILEGMTLERYARAVTIQMGGASGYAFPPMTGIEVKRTAVGGTLSLARRVGAAVLEARAGHADPIAAILSITGGRQLFTGKIVDVERQLVSGFARGVLQLAGFAANVGEALQIDFQNENLIARDGTGRVLAVVPDLICIVDATTGEPVTTEIIRYGLRVAVLGIPAPEMLKTPEALAVIGPTAFGYTDVVYQPLPRHYGAAMTASAARD